MNERSQERRARALALGLAVLFALMYVLPALTLIRGHVNPGALRVDHGETLSLTTYGRWWVRPPHHFATDALSGDLATFYNFLSDALLNVGSAATGLPPMAFQVLVYVPLLAFFFVWGGYLSLAEALEDPMMAALAAGLAAFTVDSGLSRLTLDDSVRQKLLEQVHVPFHALALGSAQGLGWTLFLPATALLFAARERFTRRRGIAHGVLFGLLFLAHTLTFIHAAFVGVAYLTMRRLWERPTGWRGRVWAAGTAALLVVFAWRAWVRPPHSFLDLAASWVAAMALLFFTDTDRRFYLWSYLPALAVVLPYALHLARNARYFGGRDGGNPVAVPAVHLLLFFALPALLAAAAVRWAPRTAALRWAVVMTGATLFLAENHLWSWGNHPYRFAINLVFPLAILGAFALRHAPRPVAWGLGLAVIAVALPATIASARNDRLLGGITAGSEAPEFLDAIRRVTDAEPDREARMLTPPEFWYPKGLVQSATILGHSSLRGFAPDYRYVLWNERYLNRLALFCFLFPYPHYDMHTGLRACADLPVEPKTFDIADRRIKTEVLPIYGLRYAAALGYPFGGPLADAAQANRWPLLAQDGDSRFHRIGATALPGVARLGAGTYSAAGFRTAIDVDEPGLQRIVIGGRKLHDRAPSVTIDDRPIAVRERNAHWIVGQAELTAGRHVLDLPRESAHWAEESDFLYFLAVVTEKDAGLYFRDHPGR